MAKKAGKAGIVAGVAAVLAVAALGVSIAANVRVSDKETTQVLGSSAFAVGQLDDTTGKLLTGEDEDKSGLYTTKYYKSEGLEIKLKEDATVKYQVNYYDADKKFLSVEEFEDDYVATGAPETAEYVKIEIIPTEDDDDTVGVFEKGGYVGQAEITVAK